MKKVILSVSCLFLTICSFSQTANERPKDIKDSPLIKARIEQQQLNVKSDIKVSEYFGLESNITDVLLNNSIPSNFPKSITYTEKAKYIEVINLWLKQNPSFVKTDKKNAVITE